MTEKNGRLWVENSGSLSGAKPNRAKRKIKFAKLNREVSVDNDERTQDVRP